MKLQEIKKFVREFKMPEKLVLNKYTTITNLDNFFESHIATMESSTNSRNIKMIHYQRVVETIQLLIENKGVEKNMTNISVNTVINKTPPPSKQNCVKSSNNDIDFKVFEGLENKSVIKPNKNFEKQQQTEPSKIKQEKTNTVDIQKEDGDSQMSLF